MGGGFFDGRGIDEQVVEYEREHGKAMELADINHNVNNAQVQVQTCAEFGKTLKYF